MRHSPATRALAAALFAFGALTGCATSTGVTRMVGGRRVEGRFVDSEAYAAFLKATVLESRGRPQEALIAYELAARQDADSPEVWTRIAALRCQLSPKSRAIADAANAFAKAHSLDAEYERTWTEQARCDLAGGALESAAREARTAIALDPERTEPVLVLTQILEQQGQVDEARRWLDGLVVRDPTSVAAYEAWLGFARRTHDSAREEAALAALVRLRPRRDSGYDEKQVRPALGEIDDALRARDFLRAKRLAVATRLPDGGLALRAAALGQATFASEQAAQVLAADPNDGDAQVAALVAADLAHDDAALRRTLGAGLAAAAPLSPLATLLLGELVGRRVGESAKRAFSDAAGKVMPGDDPLARLVAERGQQHAY